MRKVTKTIRMGLQAISCRRCRGGGGGVKGTVNLMMSDKGGALYRVNITVK
jgi:hypothetical protein